MCALMVYRDTRYSLSSKLKHFAAEGRRTRIKHASTATMEEMLVQVTQEVVGRIAGLDTPSSCRRFDRMYQAVVTVSTEYKTQLDQLVGVLTFTDVGITVESFAGVVKRLFADGQFNYGRIAAVLAFAGLVAKECIVKGVMSSDDIDKLAFAMGRTLASQLSPWISNQNCLDQLEQFCMQADVSVGFPWHQVAYTALGLTALAIFIGIN